MAKNIYKEVFRPAVQAFMYAGRREGGVGGIVAARRLAHAQRCVRVGMAAYAGQHGKINP